MKKMQTEKFITRFMMICIVLIMIGCKLLVWHEMRIKKIDVKDVKIENTAMEHQLELEKIMNEYDYNEHKNRITISGWLVKQGIDTKQVSIKVVLKNTITEEFYELPTSIVARNDITEKFDDGVNYDNSGFRVSVPYGNKLIDLEKYDYEIFLHYNIYEDEYLLPTNTTLKTWGG